MVTLIVYILYALQPLNVTYFKAFKNVFRKVKYYVMAKGKYLEPNEVTLVERMDKAFK
jgi:hypothetical protein